ncbi:MAG: copper resistance D family protein, partial [Stackebrandtia sp.]
RERRAAARLIAVGLGLVAATAGFGLYVQAAYTAGRGLGVTRDDVTAVFGSGFAAASLARLLLAAVALLLLKRVASRREPPTSRRWLLGAWAAALTATWPLSGHAVVSDAPALTIAADVVHLGAAGLWLGGLATLLVFLAHRQRVAQADALLPTWSRWATRLVAALAVAGVAQALIEVRTVEGLTSTAYGRVVLVKIGLFAVLLSVAALARSHVRRGGAAIASDGRSLRDFPARRVRRIVAVELAVAAAVLGATAVLTQTPPAPTALDASAEQRVDGPVKLEADEFQLYFELEPGRPGQNTAHLYLYTPEGAELEPLEWEAALGDPDEGIAPVDLRLTEVSSNHATADVAVPRAGDWEFVFRVQTSEIDRTTVSTVVEIE